MEGLSLASGSAGAFRCARRISVAPRIRHHDERAGPVRHARRRDRHHRRLPDDDTVTERRTTELGLVVLGAVVRFSANKWREEKWPL